MPGAYAVPTLTLSDGNPLDTVVITDGSGLDGNPLAGAVTYNGNVGANWTVNIVTSLSKPVVGSGLLPMLTLQGTDQSRGAGTLQITWSDTGFGPLASGEGFVATSASTALLPGGTLVMKTYGDTANAINGNDGSTAQSTQTFVTNPAHGTTAAPLGGPLGYPYSLTVEFDLTHTIGGTSLPNGTLQTQTVPDGGSTLLLLGSVLSSLGLVGLRRNRL